MAMAAPMSSNSAETVPRTDPIIRYYVSDASAAVTRAYTTVVEELGVRASERPRVDATTLARVYELRELAAAFAQLITDLASSPSERKEAIIHS